MKGIRLLILGLICSGQLWADPVSLEAPSNALGSSDLYGNLRIWREIEDIDFGGGLQLPLRLGFSSADEGSSQYAGRGWTIPLLESKAFLKREKMMQVILLCGKTLYLRKDTTGDNSFRTLDGDWKGVIEGNKITISRAEGWELQFRDGKLRQMRTDTGRKLAWIYNGEYVSEIQEEGGATQSPLKVVRGSEGFPTGFVVNGMLHSFDFGKRALVKSTQGIKVIDQLAPTLVGWKWPDGGKESYEFEVTPELMPTLKLIEKNQKAAEYGWDPTNGYILSDGEWTYSIVPAGEAFGMPRIERSNSQGQKEFTKTDLKTGITDRQTVETGRRITQVFSSPGVLYGKVRKIEKVDDLEGKQILLQNSYDETGKLLRRTDEAGFTTVFAYDKDGKLDGKKLLRPTSPSAVNNLNNKERNLLTAISAGGSAKDVQKLIEQLARFYINEMRQSEKALQLLPQLSDKKKAFRITVAALANDEFSDYASKIEGYRRLKVQFPEQNEYLDWMIQHSMKSSANDQN